MACRKQEGSTGRESGSKNRWEVKWGTWQEEAREKNRGRNGKEAQKSRNTGRCERAEMWADVKRAEILCSCKKGRNMRQM